MSENRQYRKGPNNHINQVRLSDALHSKLKEMATRDERSLSFVIRKACEEFAVKDDLEEFLLEDSLEKRTKKPK